MTSATHGHPPAGVTPAGDPAAAASAAGADAPKDSGTAAAGAAGDTTEASGAVDDGVAKAEDDEAAGDDTGPARRRRPRLDRETIIDAALRLATEPDPNAVSFRRLGDELGADPTAVYRHFRDKDELIEAALDRLIGAAADAAGSQAGWRQRLTVAASTYVEAVTSHPAIGTEAGHRTTGGPGELAMLELLLATLIEAGLPPSRAVQHYQLLSSYVSAMAGTQAAYLIHDRRVADAADRAWVRTMPIIDAQRFPVAAALQTDVAQLRDRDVLHTGLELLLDVVAADAARS